MSENTALPQSTTNDKVSNKICYVHMNLFTKMRYKEDKKEKNTKCHFHLNKFGDRRLLLLPFCSILSALISSS